MKYLFRSLADCILHLSKQKRESIILSLFLAQTHGKYPNEQTIYTPTVSSSGTRSGAGSGFTDGSSTGTYVGCSIGSMWIVFEGPVSPAVGVEFMLLLYQAKAPSQKMGPYYAIFSMLSAGNYEQFDGKHRVFCWYLQARADPQDEDRNVTPKPPAP